MNRRDVPSDVRDLVTTGVLNRAVALAVANAAAGQLPFAALVVRDGVVVATGVNTAMHDRDPTAHAEVAAVRNACRALGDLRLPGAVVVSSCEPCAMCVAAAAAADVARIVYAAPRESVPDLGDPAPLGAAADLVAMQDALRAVAPDRVVHVPTDGADEPFRRYPRGGDRR
jgi:guanine deaminase